MRPYALLQFLFPLALLLLFDFKRITKKSAILINAFFIFLFFWDYASVWFFLIFFGSYGIYAFRTKRLKTLLFFSPFFIAVTLWLPIFVSNLKGSLRLADYFTPSLIDEIFTISGLSVTRFILLDKKTPFLSTLVFVLPLLIVNVWSLLKNTASRLPYRLILAAFTVPFTISYLFSVLISPIFISQNLLFSSLAFLLLFSALLRHRLGHVYGLAITLILTYALRWYVIPYLPVQVESVDARQSYPEDTIHVMTYSMEDNPEFELNYFLFSQGLSPQIFHLDAASPKNMLNFQPQFFLFKSNQGVELSEQLMIQSFCYLDPSVFEAAKHTDFHLIAKCQNQ